MKQKKAIRFLNLSNAKGKLTRMAGSILARAYQKTDQDENVEPALQKAVNLADTLIQK